MKTLVVFCLAILLQPEAEAQGVTGAAEQQLERLAERPGNGAAAEDYLDDLRRLHRRPLAINSASAEDWQVFRVLTALQIQSLMRYREALGDLVSVYELQAVPGWDVATVRQLLPYLVLTDGASALRRRLRAGD
ncbi:MAG: hypothetical protein JWP27_2431, partial [Flaviaesturariibacter sp.]|nr:hypothetical protein [Flaviaesturariibacter sp.]